MYNSQEIANKIKETAGKQNKALGIMFNSPRLHQRLNADISHTLRFIGVIPLLKTIIFC